jgi:hypothetical protein
MFTLILSRMSATKRILSTTFDSWWTPTWLAATGLRYRQATIAYVKAIVSQAVRSWLLSLHLSLFWFPSASYFLYFSFFSLLHFFFFFLFSFYGFPLFSTKFSHFVHLAFSCPSYLFSSLPLSFFSFQLFFCAFQWCLFS